jgi:hypothetical protein
MTLKWLVALATAALLDGVARPDKTGTTGVTARNITAEVTAAKSVTTGRSSVTERMGFEPMIRFKPYTAFPVRRLRPLGHLSGCSKCLLFGRLRRCLSAYFPLARSC